MPNLVVVTRTSHQIARVRASEIVGVEINRRRSGLWMPVYRCRTGIAVAGHLHPTYAGAVAAARREC